MLTAYAIALPLWWALPPIEFFANGRGVMPLVPLIACLLVAVPITHWLWAPVIDSVLSDESEHTQR